VGRDFNQHFFRGPTSRKLYAHYLLLPSWRGQSVVIITGESISRSFSARIYRSCNGMAAYHQSEYFHISFLALLAGLAAGFSNGHSHHADEITPFIVTLGMMSIAAVSAFALREEKQSEACPKNFSKSVRTILISLSYFCDDCVRYCHRCTAEILKVGRYNVCHWRNDRGCTISGINVGR